MREEKGRSPWVWVGIGCGAIVLVAAIAVAAITYFTVRTSTLR